jgi:tetratricopeptide (TPR) repeat protein
MMLDVRLAIAGVAWLAIPPPLTAAPILTARPAQEAAPEVDGSNEAAADALADIRQRHQEAVNEFRKAYEAAEDESDRRKIFESKYPKAAPYVAELVALAEEFRGTPPAAEALSFAIQLGESDAQANEALELLLRDHVESAAAGEVALFLGHSSSPKAIEFLEAVVELNPHAEARGRALFSLGTVFKAQSERRGEGEGDVVAKARALAAFKTVVAEYSEVGGHFGTLGTAAEGNIFEMERLQIGMPCPEITGKDADGVEFALADYAGKVVFLDFWGFW